MSEVFCPAYADAYDVLYQDKDYAGECDRVEQILQRYGTGSRRRLLDLGCGTGSHALTFATRGYDVVGVDRSDSMIAAAQRKADEASLPARVAFHTHDLRTTALRQEFDAVLMMFAVLSYQRTNADVRAALKTVRQHLRPGGLFIADVWYGPAVLTQQPGMAFKACPLPDGELLRTSRGKLDTRQHSCTVDFQIWRLHGDRLTARTQEHHQVRYFFPLELELLLEDAGLSLLRLGAFPDFEQEADDTTWNAFIVARALET